VRRCPDPSTRWLWRLLRCGPVNLSSLKRETVTRTNDKEPTGLLARGRARDASDTHSHRAALCALKKRTGERLLALPSRHSSRGGKVTPTGREMQLLGFEVAFHKYNRRVNFRPSDSCLKVCAARCSITNRCRKEIILEI
jgi:hypothetical protein